MLHIIDVAEKLKVYVPYKNTRKDVKYGCTHILKTAHVTLAFDKQIDRLFISGRNKGEGEWIDMSGLLI